MVGIFFALMFGCVELKTKPELSINSCYQQMADSQKEDENVQLLGDESLRANQPGQNLKLG